MFSDLGFWFLFSMFGSGGLDLSDFVVDDGHDGEPDDVSEMDAESHNLFNEYMLFNLLIIYSIY